jgi:hypothetical protein
LTVVVELRITLPHFELSHSSTLPLLLLRGHWDSGLWCPAEEEIFLEKSRTRAGAVRNGRLAKMMINDDSVVYRKRYLDEYRV